MTPQRRDSDRDRNDNNGNGVPVTVPLVVRGNGNSLKGWAAVIVWALGMTLAVIVWGVRIDARVDAIERTNEAQNKYLSELDQHGSRRVQLIEERQREVFERLKQIDERLNAMEKRQTAALEALNRFLQLQQPGGQPRGPENR